MTLPPQKGPPHGRKAPVLIEFSCPRCGAESVWVTARYELIARLMCPTCAHEWTKEVAGIPALEFLEQGSRE
jgi:hypothetical protein